MGRKKKTYTPPPLPELEDDGKPSFDLKAITLMACLQYNIREKIVEIAPDYHKGLGPIPKSSIMAAIRKLGLESFLWEEDLKDDDEK